MTSRARQNSFTQTHPKDRRARHAPRVFVAALLLAEACGPAATDGAKTPTVSAAPAQAPAPVIHVVTGSTAGLSVNGYLVEGRAGVVAVDSALTVSDGKALRARLDAIGKPLLAVLLTHGHPDHYNGVSALVAGRSDVPVYATAAVSRVIREYDAKKEAQWKPMFGAEWPMTRTFPNHELEAGATLEIDGLKWTVRGVGPGESHADTYWVLEAAKRYAFVGDIVLHGEHAYVADGHTTAWLGTLHRLHDDLANVSTLYPGHGAAGGRELLDWEEEYLTAYRAEVDHLRQGATISEADKKVLESKMKERYPKAGLEFMIALGADAEAAELAGSHGPNPLQAGGSK